VGGGGPAGEGSGDAEALGFGLVVGGRLDGGYLFSFFALAVAAATAAATACCQSPFLPSTFAPTPDMRSPVDPAPSLATLFLLLLLSLPVFRRYFFPSSSDSNRRLPRLPVYNYRLKPRDPDALVDQPRMQYQMPVRIHPQTVRPSQHAHHQHHHIRQPHDFADGRRVRGEVVEDLELVEDAEGVEGLGADAIDGGGPAPVERQPVRVGFVRGAEGRGAMGHSVDRTGRKQTNQTEQGGGEEEGKIGSDRCVSLLPFALPVKIAYEDRL
jgi:hypothetical protein